MKKFLLGILLPVLTLVTIIGTGFATWYFDTNLTTSSKTTNTSVNVTAVATVGKIEVTQGQNATLELDQQLKNGNGIRLSQDIIATYTPYQSSVNVDGKQDAGEVMITIKVTFTTDQAKYVEMDSLKGWSVDTKDSNSYVKTVPAPTTTASLVSQDFKYKSEPTTIDNYKLMRDAFNASTITVVFTATASIQSNK